MKEAQTGMLEAYQILEASQMVHLSQMLQA